MCCRTADGWLVLLQEVTDDKSRLSADIADDTEAGISCDPVTGKQASKPKDIVIFVNLVDFCRWEDCVVDSLFSCGLWCIYLFCWTYY